MLRTMDNVAVFFALLMLFIFIFRYVCGSVTNRTKKTLRRRWCVLAQPRGLSNKGVGGNELVGQELLSTASKLKYCVRHCDSIRLERPKIKSMGDATYVLQPVNGFFQRWMPSSETHFFFLPLNPWRLNNLKVYVGLTSPAAYIRVHDERSSIFQLYRRMNYNTLFSPVQWTFPTFFSLVSCCLSFGWSTTCASHEYSPEYRWLRREKKENANWAQAKKKERKKSLWMIYYYINTTSSFAML